MAFLGRVERWRVPLNLAGLRGRARTLVSAPRLRARHVEWSLVSSADDMTPPPSRQLIELALDAARVALDVDLSDISERCPSRLDGTFLGQWPGEHYRLLVGLVEVLQPARVVEVGTATGMSALALLSRGQACVTTYDIVPWDEFPGTLLRREDFSDRLEQRLADLADPAVFERERGLLGEADLLFLDGPKDGRFEPALVDLLAPVLLERRCLLVLDDIRLMNMVALWRDLPLPKLDVTSLGHWSGTGLALGSGTG